MNNDSLRDTITPKSDQLNADDLMVEPITVEITSVTRGNSEQPVSIGITGGHQPYKPCKSMRRVLISIWGDNGAEWVGKSVTLFCEPSVKFGGVKVGGIRISHMSGIENPVSLMLTTTRSKRAEYTVRPLVTEQDNYEAYEADSLPALREASLSGIESLEQVFKSLPKHPHKNGLWAKHGESLKAAAVATENNQEQTA